MVEENKDLLISLINSIVSEEDKTYVPQYDTNGNIAVLVDAETGDPVETYRHSAFGEEICLPSNTVNPWRFASTRCDPETGFLYYGQRYYDPRIGRWLTPDPAGFVDSFNLYQYLLNNPFRYVDPDGRFAIAIPLILIEFGGAAGITWVMPSLMAAISTAAVYCLVQVGLTAVDQAMDNYQRMEQRKKEEHREANPITQEDLDADPNWEITTHPDAEAKGHREYTNNVTGEKVRLDKGKEGRPGHGAKDHYHKYNPRRTNEDNEYLDKDGKACGRNSEQSHLYPPIGYGWTF